MHFKAIANLVKQRRQVTFRLNPMWQEIYDVTEIGDYIQQSRKLILSASHLKTLRQTIKDICKVDVLSYSPDIERIEMTTQGADDKLAKIKPEDDFVLFKILGVTFNFQPFTNACSMRVKVDELLAFFANENISTVLVVENLDIFDRIYEFDLPCNKESTLVVYRGDSKHSPTGLKRFLVNIPKKSEIIAFTDFDPEGLRIALTLPSINAVLLPNLKHIPVETLRKYNQIDDYVKQSNARSFLSTSCNEKIEPDWQFMKTHRLSIKQQTMLSNQVPLKLNTIN